MRECFSYLLSFVFWDSLGVVFVRLGLLSSSATGQGRVRFASSLFFSFLCCVCSAESFVRFL